MSKRRDVVHARDRALYARLRERIISGIHTSHLNPGDRLPTYRQLAEEFGGDLRRAERAYRRLEEEGLVEIRGRSGVFVAPQERIGGKVLAETARWVVGMLREGWGRRIHVPDFPEFVRGCIATIRVRCACIEATEDQIFALCDAMRNEFGFESTPVRASELAVDRLDGTDLLVTTAYHATAVRPFSKSAGVPLIVIHLNPALIQEIERRVRASGLAVVCIDPLFVERVREIAGAAYADQVRGVLATDSGGLAAIDASQWVMVTRAARRVLDELSFPRLLPLIPVISPESAEELIECLVRFNLEALEDKPD